MKRQQSADKALVLKHRSFSYLSCFHVFQVAGCVLGALVCAKLTGSGSVGLLAPAVGNASVFGWEALMTAALGVTICGAAGAAAPVGIAAAVMAAVMAGESIVQLTDELHLVLVLVDQSKKCY